MNRQLIYKVSGGAMGILIVGSSFLSIRQRKRDLKTSKLLTHIKKQLATTANNLDAENAFDIYYLTKVLQNVNGQVIAMISRLSTSSSLDSTPAVALYRIRLATLCCSCCTCSSVVLAFVSHYREVSVVELCGTPLKTRRRNECSCALPQWGC